MRTKIGVWCFLSVIALAVTVLLAQQSGIVSAQQIKKKNVTPSRQQQRSEREASARHRIEEARERAETIEHQIEEAREAQEQKDKGAQAKAKLENPLARGEHPFDQPAQASDFYRQKRAPQLDGTIPVERYFDAQKRMNAMPRYSVATDTMLPSRNANPNLAADERLGTWVPLGPGNVGGRTRAFLIHPTDANIMYAGGVAGGVWKSTNAGGTWVPLTDLLPNLAIGSLVMDPKNPNVLYAGTGEGYNNIDANRGAGIFKTTDGGATWTRLTATVTSDFYYVNDLVISPVNSQRVYAATSTGVWRSLDGGTTWTRTFEPVEAFGCLDMVIRTDKLTDYIFVSSGNFDQAAIYRNVQAESSSDWVQVLTEDEMGRTTLALAPSNQNIMYALSSSLNPTREYALHAVFRSNSSGDPGSWVATRRHDGIFDLNTVLLTNAYTQFSLKCRGVQQSSYSQGWFSNAIAVDPVNPEIVWAGGIDVFRSDDGGANWGVASYWWLDQTDVKYVHADPHVIAFHPQYNGTTNQQMFVANDGGIQRTENARANTAKGDRAVCDKNLSSVTWKTLNNNYSVTQFYHGTVYPSGTIFMGGAQDNGTVIGEDRLGVNGWYDIAGGDGGYVAVDPNQVKTLYVEFTGLSLFRTYDNGGTWRVATVGITEGDENFQFITPFALDPGVARRLWIGGRTLWRTKDKAETWAAASTQLAEKVSALGVSRTDSNRVLAGVRNGTIYRSTNALSTDAATSWASTRPRTGYVSWLTWDPVDPNIAYATYSSFSTLSSDRHVYKTTDAGATWTAIDGAGSTGIPDIPVHCLVVDPRKTNVLYVGTDLGVFVSTDGGANWLVENTGFANVVTEALAFNSNNGLSHLYAFTHGRGAFKVRLSGKSAPELVITASPSVTPLVTQAVTLTATVRATGSKPTGSVTFRDNYADTKVTMRDTVTLDANGQAKITIPANTLPAGWHYFSVDYSGDGVYNPVRSNELETNVLSTTVDLSLRKTVNGIMGNGAPSIYSLIVRNGGNSSNTGPITVVDTLPAGLTYVSFAGTNWSCSASGQVVTCTYGGELKASTETTVQLTVNVGPAAVPRVTNTATCSTAGDTNLTNNTATLTSEVKPGPPIDLTVSKSHIGSFVMNANGVYNIVVKNISTLPTNAPITVVDTLPSKFSFVSGVGSGWTCSANGQIVTCTNSNVLNPAAISTIALTVAVASGAAETSVNRVCVNHPGDINSTNNCYNDSTIVRAGVDLQLTKTHAGDFGQGATGVYALNVKNNSTIPSSGTITVTDTLPAGLTYSSFSGIGWTCNAAGQTVTCTTANAINPLVVSTCFVTVNVASNAPAQVTNTAICTFANDPYLTNNSASDLTRIVPRADLAVAVVASDNPATSGAPLTYTATVRNGTSTAANAVEVLVTLPTGVTAQNVTPPTGWTVSLTGNSVKFNTTTMGANQVATFPISTKTNPAIAEGSSLQTTVRATTTTAEVTATNNTANTVTRFVTRADLVAAIRVDGRNPALEADLLTYTLTINNLGPSVALSVVSASKLSPGLVITECTPLVSGTCTSTADGVNVTYPSLNAGAIVNVRIVAKVVGAQVQGSTLTHNVNVSTTTADPLLSNNIVNASVNAAPAQMKLTIDGGKTQFDFAVFAAMRELLTNLPSQLFTVQNLGVQPLVLDFALRRTGTDVTSGKISNSNDLTTFPLYLLPETTGSETAVTSAITIAGGATRRFRLAYQPLLPAVIGRATNLAASDLIPENLTAAVSITPNVGTALTIPITGKTAAAVKFVHPTLPRQAPLATIFVNGQNEHVVDFSAYDANNDFTSVTYQFLDRNNAAVGAPVSFPLGTEIATAGWLKGQSFTVSRKFANASARPTVYRARITINDGAGSVTVVTDPIPPPKKATAVSAASYKAEGITNGSIVAIFGEGSLLATATEIARVTPLPTALAGTKVAIVDSKGAERMAPLFFVSPGQVNILIPDAAAAGVGKIVVTSANGVISEGAITIATVAPSLFTSNASGSGVPAGVLLRIKKDGTQTYEAISRYDTAMAKYVPVPIDFGTATGTNADQLYLILFGTGWRGLSGLSGVSAKVVTTGTTAGNPVTLTALYAGTQGSLAGLDQLNLQLPITLKGRGALDLLLTMDGKAANTVSFTVK